MFVRVSLRKADWRAALDGGQVSDAMNRRERRSSETRERLFHAAMSLFRDRGFHKTTVEDITNSADVGKGTFFNYFPSKEHVLSVLAEVQSAKYDNAADLAHKGDTRAALRWLYHALPAEGASSPKMVRSMFTVFLTSEPVRGFLTPTLTKARGKLGGMFREAEGRGEIPPNSDVQNLAYRFQQSLFGSMLLWTLQSPPPPLEEWLDNGFDFFWAAVSSPPCSERNRTGSKK